MAGKPQQGGNTPPGTNRRMMTPPPPGQARKSTGTTPAIKSSGQLPTVGGPQVAAPPAAAGPGRAAPAPAGPPQRRSKPKTQGMPIKTKIVLAMSSLAVGVSLLIFLIVMLIATTALESTIQQAGVGMLQQAEAIHRPYRAGLNEKGLIAYFGQPANREKFDKYWQQMEWDERAKRGSFHARIPACREFANWEQFKEDRVWVLVAGNILDNPRDLNLSDAAREEAIKFEILGEGWAELRDLKPNQRASAPNAPRRINKAAMERYKSYFSKLFRDNGLDAGSDKFERLKARIDQDTENRLIEGPQGLRKTIFRFFQEDFVKDLEELTTADDSQVRFIFFQIPDDTLPRFRTEELNVVSPRPRENRELERLASSDVVTKGDVSIDRGAFIGGVAAYSFSKSLSPGESISIYLDREQIQSRKQALIWSILGISFVGIGLSIALAFLIGGSITKPLQTLMTDIEIISGGNFDHRPMARSSDEIGIVSRLLGDMAAGLKEAQKVWLENQGRKHDLDIAKEIQENLLPKHVPRIAGYDVSAYYSPSKEVGGDYYDFFLVDKTHLGMICADVSGKGIPGSMVMMMAKALVSYEAQDNLSPRDIFCKVNRTLAKDIKRGMFVTAFYMLLDIPTARLTVASAGHNPLLLYRAATKQCIEVNPGGIALGFDKDGRLFERNMKEEVIQLQRGDRAVIYTDGVTEAMSPTNEEFGEQRMQAITIQCAGKTSAEYLTTLVNAIQGHAQTDDQHDDITIVTLKVG
ncbi:MAG: SpoIIE family protein phosphatase [Planctomycetes bacterium]|nr:SpoIIE family protein phosphatase [Planctomycetota bacterium]MCW8134595.1 SpoIIE family protein phosphatase [Planctomycetota bacterium]